MLILFFKEYKVASFWKNDDIKNEKQFSSSFLIIFYFVSYDTEKEEPIMLLFRS